MLTKGRHERWHYSFVNKTLRTFVFDNFLFISTSVDSTASKYTRAARVPQTTLNDAPVSFFLRVPLRYTSRKVATTNYQRVFLRAFFFSSFLYLIFNTSLTVSSINFNIQFYFFLLPSPPPPEYFPILSSSQLPKMAPKFLRGDLRTTIFRRIDLEIRTIPIPNHTGILVFEDATRRILRREESRLVIRARNSSKYILNDRFERPVFTFNCVRLNVSDENRKSSKIV